MSQSWTERVEFYLDALQECAEAIDLILDATKVHTVGLDPDEVQRSTDDLTAALNQLQHKFSERDELLADSDAPTAGATLTEKLRESNHIDHPGLVIKCAQITETVEMASQRAVSLFVCQYHLLDLSSEIVRMLSGSSAPPTYGSETTRPTPRGGTLFNEAA